MKFLIVSNAKIVLKTGVHLNQMILINIRKNMELIKNIGGVQNIIINMENIGLQNGLEIECTLDIMNIN
mgnify:CR=1 FL=1